MATVPVKALTVATVALAGLLALPATASAASRAPRTYQGTITLHQAPVRGTLPTGNSSASYRFHARYRVSGKRVRRGRKGAQYPLIGRGNQALAYSVNLNDTANPNNTHTNVADWHGSGAWTKRSGNVAVLDVTGRRFALQMGLLLARPGTIPLSVSSQETDFFSDDSQSCTSRLSQSGSTISIDAPCSSDVRSVTIPVPTIINPDVLLGNKLPFNRVCPGTKSVVALYHGFCGSAKRGGRVRRVYTTTYAHPTEYPFSPFSDEGAASEFGVDARLFYAALGWWGDLVIRTTFTVDLKPGR